MKSKHVYFTAPDGTRRLRSSTYALKGGGYLHFDHFIQPIELPSRLGADQPLARRKANKAAITAEDAKMPIAETGELS